MQTLTDDYKHLIEDQTGLCVPVIIIGKLNKELSLNCFNCHNLGNTKQCSFQANKDLKIIYNDFVTKVQEWLKQNCNE